VPEGAFPGLVEPGVVVVVRPDRYVAAVAAIKDVATVTDRLSQSL
jgi:hypothetical protein